MILSIHTGRPVTERQVGRHRRPDMSFLHRARRVVEQLRTARSASTVDNYCTALRSLERFLRSEGRPEAMLSRAVVERYDRWLDAHGVGVGTRSCYLRSLRALLRRVVGQQRGAAAFATVFTGNPPTRHRALSVAAVRRLRALDVGGDRGLALSRDVLLFSIFALGMPFVDVALLRWRDLRGGYFVYHRRKTGAEVRVRLEPCMREIAERWRSQADDRVFPLVAEGLEGADWVRAYRRALGRYNARLRQLARLTRLAEGLSSYTARHTWATMAWARGMDLQLISAAMGHRSAQTTMVYIARKEHARVARMNKKVLEMICGGTGSPPRLSQKRGHTYCKEVQPEG